MAAHPGVSIKSGLVHRTSSLTTATASLGARHPHPYLTRRKRSATAISTMASNPLGIGDGTGSGRSSTSTSSASSSSSSSSDEASTGVPAPGSSLDGQLPRPPEGPETHGGMEGAGGGVAVAEGDEGDLFSVGRWSRVLSCPAGGERLGYSPGRRGRGRGASSGAGRGRQLSGAFVVASSADNVSSARGITMGDVRGSVRAKTGPAAGANAAAPAPPAPATAASTEASALTVTSGLETVSLKLTCGDPEEVAAAAAAAAAAGSGGSGACGVGQRGGGGDERSLRAMSSASVLGAPAPEASYKRAKSGAMTGEATNGALQQPIDVAAAKTAAAAAAEAAAAAAATEGCSAPPADGRATSAASADPASSSSAAAAAAASAALSNDEWVARLSPLLEAIPAGTHPEDFLHDILRERGYSTEMAAMKETTFHRPPEPDQVAAYDKAILSAVLDEDEGTLERMRVAGRRMDACNRFGDSVLHMACRRGRAAALRFLLRATGPAGVMLSDDFGRTVLHDACWTATPRFDVASAVLDADTRLLRTLDSRGSSPLQYVPQDQWPLWCAFFESRKEIYWPRLAPGVEDIAGIIPLTVDYAGGWRWWWCWGVCLGWGRGGSGGGGGVR